MGGNWKKKWEEAVDQHLYHNQPFPNELLKSADGHGVDEAPNPPPPQPASSSSPVSEAPTNGVGASASTATSSRPQPPVSPASAAPTSRKRPASPSNGATSPKRTNFVLPLLLLAAVVIDIAKAYLNCPVMESHLVHNRIVVYSPEHGRFFGFQGYVSFFGNANSVVTWCRISCGLAAVCRRFMRVWFNAYIDDFPAFPPRQYAADVLVMFLALLDALGLPYNRRKAKWGPILEILGLIFDCTNERGPCFYISEERKASICRQIDTILADGSLDPDVAKSLLGRLFFVFSALVDRTFNPLLRPIRLRAEGGYDDGTFAWTLSNRLRDCLLVAKQLVSSNLIRFPAFEDPFSENMLLYTDASFSHGQGWIAAVLVVGGRFLVFRIRVTAAMIHESTRLRPINFLEACAPSVAARVFSCMLQNEFWYTMVDNDAAKDALLNQDSSGSVPMAAAAFQFWRAVSLITARPWISRIPSPLNIADILTRESRLQFIMKFFPQLFTFFDVPDDINNDLLSLLSLDHFSEYAALIVGSSSIDPSL